VLARDACRDRADQDGVPARGDAPTEVSFSSRTKHQSQPIWRSTRRSLARLPDVTLLAKEIGDVQAALDKWVVDFAAFQANPGGSNSQIVKDLLGLQGAYQTLAKTQSTIGPQLSATSPLTPAKVAAAAAAPAPKAAPVQVNHFHGSDMPTVAQLDIINRKQALRITASGHS
jgi:hypothetical protein